MRDWSESGEKKYEGVKVKIFGGLLIGVYFEELLLKDVSWAIFSLLFVFLFIWYHL